MTNAGLNPARDLGPRIVGYLVGFKAVAFSPQVFLVYTLGPCVGSALAALVFTKVIEPLQQSKSNNNCCC